MKRAEIETMSSTMMTMRTRTKTCRRITFAVGYLPSHRIKGDHEEATIWKTFFGYGHRSAQRSYTGWSCDAMQRSNFQFRRPLETTPLGLAAQRKEKAERPSSTVG